MSKKRERRRSLVLVDSRSRDEEPLRSLLELAAVEHLVHVVANSERALEVVGSVRPSGVLVHAGLEPRVDAPAVGPLLAASFRRFTPGVPVVLYTGNLSTGHERTLAQFGIPTPVVHDRRLLDSFHQVENADRQLVWEGGDPDCSWPRDRFLRLQPIPDAPRCWWDAAGRRPDPECCCNTRRDQMVVVQDMPEVALPAGTVVEFHPYPPGDHPYVAASQGGYTTTDSPCTADVGVEYGSAFIARLSE